MDKPILIGESNPYGGDPEFALYPSPIGCAGHRLCCLILGMDHDDYLDAFERRNLCPGHWSIKHARQVAQSIWENDGRFILLGAKVCSAWQTPFEPFKVFDGGTCVVLPHPSGLCRLWSEPRAVAKARTAVLAIAPELAGKIGAVKP